MNQFWKIAAIFMFGFGVGGIVKDSFFGRVEASQDKPPAQIRAHEIVLVDQDGVPRIGIKAEKNSSSGFFIYDSKGEKTLANLSVDKNGVLAPVPLCRAKRFETVDQYGRAFASWDETSFKMATTDGQYKFDLNPSSGFSYDYPKGQIVLRDGSIRLFGQLRDNLTFNTQIRAGSVEVSSAEQKDKERVIKDSRLAASGTSIDSLTVDVLKVKSGGELVVDSIRSKEYLFPTVHAIKADVVNGLYFVTGRDKGQEIRKTVCFCNR